MKNTMNGSRSAVALFMTAIMLPAALIGATASANAQDAGRFRMEKTPAGLVRFDSQTGAITICSDQQGQLNCKMLAEDRQAYEEQIAKLQERVSSLEARLDKLDKSAAATGSALPSEQEFEQTMSYMERFMRRFMNMARSFDDDPVEAKPDPGRT